MSALAVTRTLVEKDGKGFLEFRVAEGAIPAESALKDDEVLVSIEAAPINPSDIGPLFIPSQGGIGRFGGALASADSNGRTTTALPVADKSFKAMKKAHGRPGRVGNEGAGRVVAAGKGEKAQSLKGKLVAVMGAGGTYAQYGVVNVDNCLEHFDGTTAEDAASSFVNPLTALGMTKTMRGEGHTGIVHTAAASQLGQMLVKICLADGIPLVNVVRRQEQVDLLKSLGAQHIVNTSSASYQADLVEALSATGATIAFDATGGGTLGFEILKSMETAAVRRGVPMSPYGSTAFKKLYIYGGLNAGEPLTLYPHAGMGGFSWSVAGFLLGTGHSAITEDSKQRVAREIKTTFATTYARRLSLEQMLDVATMAEYQKQASNSKALVTPQVVSSKL